MEISELPKDKKTILFDGVCNLCDSAVQFVIKNDKKDVFRFVIHDQYHISVMQELIEKIGVGIKHNKCKL